MRLMLAPMEGVVDHTMRALFSELGGIDRCVTEFLRVSDRLLPARVFHRLCPELDNGGTTAEGLPVYLQLLGGQAAPLSENAARGAELGAPGIDLNFGCPAKTVNKSDGGAIILRNPERVLQLVSAVRHSVPENIPVTVKTRLGYEDRENFLDVVRAVEEAGATELTVHARTKKHGYRPPAYWEEIARARDVTTLPLIANGEIWSLEDARRCREISGCEDLMLGRGALCRPDLARLIKADSRGESPLPLSWQEIPPLLLRFLDFNIASYDSWHAGNPVKQWLVYLRNYYPQGALLFQRVKRLKDPFAMRELIAAEMAHPGNRAA